MVQQQMKIFLKKNYIKHTWLTSWN